MFNTFNTMVASRFRRSKQQDGYIAFVSKSSTFGISLGCAVLILLLSVMNGFEKELRDNLLNVVPHGELITASGVGIAEDPVFINALKQDPRIEHVFMLNKASGLLQKGRQIKSVELLGADEDYFTHKFANSFDYALISDTPNGIVLGKTLMETLDAQVGDSIQLMLPKVTQDLSFQTSVSQWLTIVGEVNLGGEIDNFIGITSSDTLSALLDLQFGTTHIEIHLFDPFLARQTIQGYGWSFNQAVLMSDWMRTHGHLYQDIQLVRTVVYIVLILVISVASFNIVSSLVMSVKEKSREIAILKTMGATASQIRQIFVLKGLHSGLVGATIGSVIGCLLGAYLPDMINAIEAVTGIQLFDAGVYFTSAIPSQLQLSDVVITYCVALIITVLATLYPANKAASVMPAAHLH
ncbi:FtsX-like permease family protein [Glaciecola sp. XM2]|uniref:FtsX-like permease family protein n=1 Tax=Glaciecola sp. XM2 TaxID=1914931 RepID=UPI001BDDEF44|nr:FtsX-like permease family protein [Glaciecola sp. XM2]MBT1449711.1 FtsX-like permease family protein [Glaciecola sp. XM2]